MRSQRCRGTTHPGEETVLILETTDNIVTVKPIRLLETEQRFAGHTSKPSEDFVITPIVILVQIRPPPHLGECQIVLIRIDRHREFEHKEVIIKNRIVPHNSTSRYVVDGR